MKILNIIQCTHLGGMERSNMARLQSLAERGHECFLVSLHSHGALLPLLEEQRIPTTDLAYEKNKLSAFFRLRRLLRYHAHDALILTGHNLLATLALPRRNRHRQVLCIHFHHKGVKPGWFWKLYYRLAMQKFACIFFNSKFIHDEAVALVPQLASVCAVLPNIYELPPAITADRRRFAREELGILPEAVVVGNAGWLIRRKRFDVFIATALRIKERLPGVVFLIAGDGEERERLEEQSAAAGLAEDIRWLGWLKDIDAFYAATDLVLFNTDWDAVARTPIEAGVRGVNVVCSELNGGLRDLFNNPEWILDDHDPERLAGLAAEMLADQKKQTLQIEQIRGAIKQKCSPQVHVDRLLESIEIWGSN